MTRPTRVEQVLKEQFVRPRQETAIWNLVKHDEFEILVPRCVEPEIEPFDPADDFDEDPGKPFLVERVVTERGNLMCKEDYFKEKKR